MTSDDEGSRTYVESPDSVYKQCQLRAGNTTKTAWLPDVMAEPGLIVRLATDGWKISWTVEAVGASSTLGELSRTPDIRVVGRDDLAPLPREDDDPL